MAKRKLITFTLPLLITIALAPSIARSADVVEETIEKKYSVDPTARFTFQNDDGSVLIYGADIAEMKVQAIKKAYSKERLDKIDINVAVRPGEISVKTEYPPKPKWGLFDRSGTVDYVIVLPWRCDVQRVELGTGEISITGMRGSEVNARLGNGRLFGRNCFTDLHVSSSTGVVDIAYEWWEDHPIVLSTNITEGRTYLTVPGDAQFRLRAETVDGHVFTDLSALENPTEQVQAKVDLLIGDNPDAEMQLRALHGSIKITEAYP